MLDPHRDLLQFPVTQMERLFLELAFVHYHTGWLICREETALTSIHVLSMDAGNFFRLPVPAAVWATIRRVHQPEFVQFVDAAVAKAEKDQSTNPSSERLS